MNWKLKIFMVMFKKILKNIFYSAVQFWPAKGAVVLMYHSIGGSAEFFTVKPEEFEKQMAYLVEHKFNVISVSTLSALLVAKQAIPRKTIIITFDDGYADNYYQAWPVLKKYHLSVDIFLITDRVSGTNTTRRGNTFPMLNWEQIREMEDSGLVKFYPHSHSHPKLPSLSPETVAEEILTSRKILEEQLGGERNIFAYPYGQSSPEAVQILQKNNFRSAFTVQTGRVQVKDHPLFLRRNSIDSGTSFTMFKGIVKYGRI